MTPEEARAHVAKQDQECASLYAQVTDLASRHMGQVVLAMLDALLALVAGREEFYTLTRIRVYRAVIQNLAGRGLR